MDSLEVMLVRKVSVFGRALEPRGMHPLPRRARRLGITTRQGARDDRLREKLEEIAAQQARSQTAMQTV